MTRTFPPVSGKDLTDHGTIHPGIWLAFGDLDGLDFWRNKGRVVAEKVDVEGTAIVSRLAYRWGERVVCRETCRITFRVRPEGLEITFDSVFSSDKDFAFGDQEEMGLGMRLATPLSVQGGGRILDSENRKNEKEMWGKEAAWADYGGSIDGRRAGLILVPHADNFRPCRLHARDYGFIAANPFGRKSFGQGEASRIAVRVGETLRLRFGIVAYVGDVDAKAVAASIGR